MPRSSPSRSPRAISKAEPAFTEELVLITPKGHARVSTPKDLRERDASSPSPAAAPIAAGSKPGSARSSMVAERVMEYGSYHAIVACAAAGVGIAVVPRSVLRASGMEAQLAVHALPPKIAQCPHPAGLAPRPPSGALDALRKELR